MSLRLGSIRYTPEGYRKIPIRIHRQVPEIEEVVRPRVQRDTVFLSGYGHAGGWRDGPIALDFFTDPNSTSGENHGTHRQQTRRILLVMSTQFCPMHPIQFSPIHLCFS